MTQSGSLPRDASAKEAAVNALPANAYVSADRDEGRKAARTGGSALRRWVGGPNRRTIDALA